jgi:hypothetical protein
MCSVLFVLKTSALLSVVPMNLVLGFVPALPVSNQLCAFAENVAAQSSMVIKKM